MADDFTHQQLLEAITDMFARQSEIMATKDGLAKLTDQVTCIEQTMATKDDIARFERKLDSHKRTSVQYHLATRQEIGELNRKFDHLREGLARAAQ